MQPPLLLSQAPINPDCFGPFYSFNVEVRPAIVGDYNSVVAGNNFRVAIIFARTDVYFWEFHPIPTIIGNGAPVVALLQEDFAMLDFRTHGRLVQAPWSIRGQATGGVVSITEIFYNQPECP